MKKALIVALIGINVGLLGWVLAKNVPQANAQVSRGGSDYLTVTAKTGKDTAAIWILDLSKRRLAAWRMDINRTPPRMTMFKGSARDLARDFRLKSK